MSLRFLPLVLAASLAAAPALAQTPDRAPPLPPGVTPLRDDRPARFALTGGNVFDATRVGEDSEFFWVQLSGGGLARVRKSEVVSLRYGSDPVGRSPARRPRERPPSLDPVPEDVPRPRRRGKGLVVGGGVLLGVFYLGTLLFVPSAEGPAALLAVPVLGPVLYGVARSLEPEDVAGLAVVSVLQAAGAVMLVLGIRQLTERPRRQAWLLAPVVADGSAGVALVAAY